MALWRRHYQNSQHPLHGASLAVKAMQRWQAVLLNNKPSVKDKDRAPSRRRSAECSAQKTTSPSTPLELLHKARTQSGRPVSVQHKWWSAPPPS